MFDDVREWNAHQRAGQVVVWLLRGNSYTTTEIAQLTGLTFYGARYMMDQLSLRLPIVRNEDDNRWFWLCESD